MSVLSNNFLDTYVKKDIDYYLNINSDFSNYIKMVDDDNNSRYVNIKNDAKIIFYFKEPKVKVTNLNTVDLIIFSSNDKLIDDITHNDGNENIDFHFEYKLNVNDGSVCYRNNEVIYNYENIYIEMLDSNFELDYVIMRHGDYVSNKHYDDYGICVIEHIYEGDGTYKGPYIPGFYSDDVIEDEYLEKIWEWINNNNIKIDYYGRIIDEDDLMLYRLKF